MSKQLVVEEMVAKDLKAALGELGVAFKAKAKVEELREQLKAALDRKALGENPANDPFCEVFGDGPKSGNPGCMACLKDFGKRYDACLEIAEEAKAAKKSGKSSGPSTKVRGKYTNFEELKANLEGAPEKRLTMVVDKLLLEGNSVKEILAEVEERKKAEFKESNDFKSAAIIQKHIRFRASKGWMFTIHPDGKVQLTGYASEPQEVSFTPAAKPTEEEAKAA